MGLMKNVSLRTLTAALLACVSTIACGSVPWDFNGDGKSDVASEDSVSKSGYVYLMNGYAVLSSGTVYMADKKNSESAVPVI